MYDLWRPRLLITTGDDRFYVTTVAQHERAIDPCHETNYLRIILPDMFENVFQWENYIQSFFTCAQRFSYEGTDQKRRLRCQLTCLEPSFSINEIVPTNQSHKTHLPLGRIAIQSRIEPIVFWIEPAHVMVRPVSAGTKVDNEVAIIIPHNYALQDWYNIVLSTISPATDTKLFVSAYLNPQIINLQPSTSDLTLIRCAYNQPPDVDFVPMKHGRFI